MLRGKRSFWQEWRLLREVCCTRQKVAERDPQLTCPRKVPPAGIGGHVAFAACVMPPGRRRKPHRLKRFARSCEARAPRILLSTGDPPVVSIGISERSRFQCSQRHQMALELQLLCFLTRALSLLQQVAVPFDQYVDPVLAGHAASISLIMCQVCSMLSQPLVFFCKRHFHMSGCTVLDCVSSSHASAARLSQSAVVMVCSIANKCLHSCRTRTGRGRVRPPVFPDRAPER